MKVILLFALVFVAHCADGPLFDVTKFFETEDQIGGAPISISVCSKENRFKYLKSVLKPTEIIKGEDILIKVQGVALEKMIVKNLHLVTLYNGGEIFVDNKSMGMKPLEPGKKFAYDYTASIPTFTPSGSWDILLKLQDDKGQEIHCLKAHFDMP